MNHTEKNARILIVDDHQIVRQSLSHLINQEPGLRVCGEAEDAPGALQAIAAKKPDIVILDISLKGAHSIDLIRKIRKKNPDLPVLVLSMYEESLYAKKVLDAGAGGYITKHEATEKLVPAIRAILSGETFVGGAE